MKKFNLLPVFSSKSGMHRVFGDSQPFTEVHAVKSILVNLISRSGVTIAVRYFCHRYSSSSLGAQVLKRFEVYNHGILVDYTMDRELSLKTFRFIVNCLKND